MVQHVLLHVGHECLGVAIEVAHVVLVFAVLQKDIHSGQVGALLKRRHHTPPVGLVQLLFPGAVPKGQRRGVGHNAVAQRSIQNAGGPGVVLVHQTVGYLYGLLRLTPRTLAFADVFINES